ncbi:TIGR03745 family integrating conjugative element membrane protein [Pseudomonas sp. RW407]|uniref:TIGR03745 family integrating conjugative element membrane protein n=1 Tax=Pseudomonas sp. RW407 TaxID=2202894 RepID=UPI000D6EF72B|nr:TIGR03745 family integrating conjugative element membrane protein [Pseudomonas sp. RW407]PWU28661.1 TIGR03745 family integrating conjugative element membrane protein [Pseudomonas sp. RW407]
MPKLPYTRAITLSTILLALPQLANAALPQAQAPSRGEGSNWLQTIQNFAYDGGMLLGLIILATMISGVAWHAYGVYHEIHDGKKKWRDLGATAVVGIAIIGVGIFMISKATTIL